MELCWGRRLKQTMAPKGGRSGDMEKIIPGDSPQPHPPLPTFPLADLGSTASTHKHRHMREVPHTVLERLAGPSCYPDWQG